MEIYSDVIKTTPAQGASIWFSSVSPRACGGCCPIIHTPSEVQGSTFPHLELLWSWDIVRMNVTQGKSDRGTKYSHSAELISVTPTGYTQSKVLTVNQVQSLFHTDCVDSQPVAQGQPKVMSRRSAGMTQLPLGPLTKVFCCFHASLE